MRRAVQGRLRAAVAVAGCLLAAVPGRLPPGWLGTRVLPTTAAGYGVQRPTPTALRERAFTLPDTLPELPGRGFAARVEQAPAAVLARSTWRPGCPVASSDLDWLRLTFWGFDERRHTGELLVNHSASADLVRVFRTLYEARFPIEQMTITTTAEQNAPPTGDGNDTGAFACRPTRGASFFSQHAYGLAVDVDPFQNPYQNGSVVLPELAGAYTDRSDVRPGMIEPGDVVVRAFAAVGWGWGGDFTRLKDRQHFSADGR
ncbi:M15 family peptidase [Nocardioides mangrovicus]|uniref:M15 family peptidase n=1 Tax=Nocardioides mangrovicus TaxID=2478913 RepID=A0A3L8P091_9ACTN|nr:M15 family metallopeptidase [Nocardioides mangrovicus]RLV47989.1 M15 family peptidase [Nocardioides mangrovicus]